MAGEAILAEKEAIVLLQVPRKHTFNLIRPYHDIAVTFPQDVGENTNIGVATAGVFTRNYTETLRKRPQGFRF